MAQKKHPAKHWFLTINNPTDEDSKGFTVDGDTMAPHLDYLMIGFHVGEKDKVPHIHAVICLKKKTRFSALKKMYPRANIQPRKGTLEECAIYLNKYNGGMKEWGERPQNLTERNKRTWDDAFALAKAGKLEDIPKVMLIRYYHAFKRIKQDYPAMPQHLKAPCGEWWWGETGSGKTLQAWTTYPDLYPKAKNKWWDGYQGEEIVLVDEVMKKDSSWIVPFLMTWSDCYRFPAEQKGTTVQIRPVKIIVTSNYCILDFCEDHPLVTQDALMRRFTDKHFVKNKIIFP